LGGRPGLSFFKKENNVNTHIGRGCVQAQSTKVKAEPLPTPDDAASPYPYREPQVCPGTIVGLFPFHLNSALDPLCAPCGHIYMILHSIIVQLI
jgi:hypothetical protein